MIKMVLSGLDATPRYTVGFKTMFVMKLKQHVNLKRMYSPVRVSARCNT